MAPLRALSSLPMETTAWPLPLDGNTRNESAPVSCPGHSAQLLGKLFLPVTLFRHRPALTGLLPRLLTWYSIFTVLFRCPATLDECTEDSPLGCKQYFQLKHTVVPHIEPYYNSYAAPYVELAKPYYETVDKKVLTPGWAYATKYGGPRVTQVQEFGQTQWEKTVQPELTKYQALAKAKYDQNLAPHVDKASATVAPYYDIARTSALQTYHDIMLPSYVFAQPYVQQGYSTALTFTTETAVPAAAWAWNNTIVFLDSTVWPQLRSLYTENVEPQLLKITQRIGRHNASNTQKVAETISRYAAFYKTFSGSR